MKDKDDVYALIAQKLSVSEDRIKAASERAEKVGGDIPTVGLQRWQSAKWTEVEIEL